MAHQQLRPGYSFDSDSDFLDIEEASSISSIMSSEHSSISVVESPLSEDEVQRRALKASIQTLKEDIAVLERQLRDTQQERAEIRLERQILRRNETLRLQRLRQELYDASMV